MINGRTVAGKTQKLSDLEVSGGAELSRSEGNSYRANGVITGVEWESGFSFGFFLELLL